MTFVSRLQEVTLRLLTTYGQLATVTRETQGTFDPSSGGVGTGATSTYTILCQPQEYLQNEIDGILVKYGDIKLISYSDETPEVGDIVTLDSTYRIMFIQRHNVQGSTVYYTLQLRY